MCNMVAQHLLNWFNCQEFYRSTSGKTVCRLIAIRGDLDAMLTFLIILSHVIL